MIRGPPRPTTPDPRFPCPTLLRSIRGVSGQFKARLQRRDILGHNAAAIMVPRGRTRDGFELQIGTNHLGPFALTGLLFDALCAAPQARVVRTGSLAHRMSSGLAIGRAS